MTGPQNNHARIRVTVRNEAAEAVARVEPTRSRADTVTELDINAALDDRGVSRSCLDHEAIRRLAEDAAEHPDSPHERVVARGTPPEHGVDGHIEMLVEPLDPSDLKPDNDRSDDEPPSSTEEPPPENDPESSTGVDHYRGPTFTVIGAGQPIARIHPATTGSDGVDVFSKVIPAHQGTEPDPKFGESIVRKGNTLLSVCPGVLWIRAGLLEVGDRLDIPGDIDFATGNIDFPGDVAITGGIKDRFVVKASGDLRVGELVEAASLSAGRDVFIHRGMVGRDKGTIASGGSLSAHYLDSVRARIAGDASIDREINDCRLDVAGRLLAPKATMLGGVLRVAHHAELGALGTAAGRETTVYLGSVPSLESLTARCAELETSLTNQFDALQQAIAQASSGDDPGDRPSTDQLTALTCRASICLTKRRGLRETMARTLSQIEARSSISLSVQRAVNPGAQIVIGATRYVFRCELKGPVSIELDSDATPIVRDLRKDSTLRLDAVSDARDEPGGLDRHRLRRLLSDAA